MKHVILILVFILIGVAVNLTFARPLYADASLCPWFFVTSLLFAVVLWWIVRGVVAPPRHRAVRPG
jgi:heme/copper-type cytochrome/quinol oxidase subunit 2